MDVSSDPYSSEKIIDGIEAEEHNEEKGDQDHRASELFAGLVKLFAITNV